VGPSWRRPVFLSVFLRRYFLVARLRTSPLILFFPCFILERFLENSTFSLILTRFRGALFGFFRLRDPPPKPFLPVLDLRSLVRSSASSFALFVGDTERGSARFFLVEFCFLLRPSPFLSSYRAGEESSPLYMQRFSQRWRSPPCNVSGFFFATFFLCNFFES